MTSPDSLPHSGEVKSWFLDLFGSGVKCPFAHENGRMIAAKSFPDKQADAVSIQIYNALKT